MQVEAIYTQGRIELVQPLRLRHDGVRLLVTVPDEEVETKAMPTEGTMESRVRAILRPYQHLLDRAAADSPSDYDSIRDAYLADKYFGQQ